MDNEEPLARNPRQAIGGRNRFNDENAGSLLLGRQFGVCDYWWTVWAGTGIFAAWRKSDQTRI